MVFPFPSFHGLNEEDAEDFCNNFELACRWPITMRYDAQGFSTGH